MQYLILMILFLTYSAPAQEQRESPTFSSGDLNFKETVEYTFEMEVTLSNENSMKLKSSKVYKQTSIAFSPTNDTMVNSEIYANYKYSNDFGKLEDETVSLEFQLSNFVENNGSFWFADTEFSFEEKFQPTSVIAPVLNRKLNQARVSSQSVRFDYLTKHIYLGSMYVLDDLYSNEYIESKVFDRYLNTTNTVNTAELSFKVRIEFNNMSFFASNSQKQTLNAKSLQAFYFGNSNLFAKELLNSVRKSKDVLYSYLLYDLGGIHAQNIIRDSDTNSDIPEVKVVTINSSRDNKNLFCIRLEMDKFECKIKMEYMSKISMPSSKTLAEGSDFPHFVINELQKNGYSNERMRKEMAEINFSEIIKVYK